MAGRYAASWCPYHRTAAGLDCPDAAQDPKALRKADRAALRRYVTRELEDEMGENWEPVGTHVAWEGAEREKRRALAAEKGYDATIRPWSGGWEVFDIVGPGVEKGATQACTLDEVEYMAREYIACALDLVGEDNDEWELDTIPVRLTLDLEPHNPRQQYGVRAHAMDVLDKLSGERMALVEETTWWLEPPTAQ